MTQLLPDDIRERLLTNGRARQLLEQEGRFDPDFFPVVRLYIPSSDYIWLLTELDPDDPDIAFGLCDLGMAFPELGSVSISELEDACDKLGVPIAIDHRFAPCKTISVYAVQARKHQRVVSEDEMAEDDE
jgi:Protein of unknown function (DUF2958)